MAQGSMIAGIGFNTIQQRDLSDLDQILGRIKDLGASHAELSLYNADLIAGGRLLAHRVDRLARICARHDLRYTVHGPMSVNFMDANQIAPAKAAVAAMLEICGVIGASLLVQHAGRATFTTAERIEHLHAQERDAWRALGEEAARQGVRIGVETLFVSQPGHYTAHPERLAREIRAIGHPHVCGTLDFSHSYLTSTRLGLDYAAQLKAFAPVAGHLHVHDSFGQPKLGEKAAPSEDLALGLGDLHLPLGWGDLPWEEVLPQLAFEDGTVFMLELPWHFLDEAAACVASARRLVGLIGKSQAGT